MDNTTVLMKSHHCSIASNEYKYLLLSCKVLEIHDVVKIFAPYRSASLCMHVRHATALNDEFDTFPTLHA